MVCVLCSLQSHLKDTHQTAHTSKKKKKKKSFTYISQIQEAVEEDKSHVLPSHSLHEKYSSVTRRTETAQIKNEKFKKYLKGLQKKDTLLLRLQNTRQLTAL